MEFFNYFEIILGIYLLYAAITGKGKYYENPYTKVPREQYVKVMRILALIVGVMIMISPALQLLGVLQPNSPVSWVLWGVTMLGIITMLVANVKMTDRAKAKAAQSGQRVPTENNPDPLRAAFVFDDEPAEKNDKE